MICPDCDHPDHEDWCYEKQTAIIGGTPVHLMTTCKCPPHVKVLTLTPEEQADTKRVFDRLIQVLKSQVDDPDYDGGSYADDVRGLAEKFNVELEGAGEEE
jgi:hypothetical protein